MFASATGLSLFITHFMFIISLSPAQALMVLVKMLKEAQEPVHQSEALFVLAGLLQSNDTLQRRLYDLKVVSEKLTKIRLFHLFLYFILFWC